MQLGFSPPTGRKKMNINKAIVEKVISLAKKHQQTYHDFYNKHPDEIGFPLDEKYKSTSEYRKEKKSVSVLVAYLNSLNYESIKNLQTLMYLGRDQDYSDADSYDDRFDHYRKFLDLQNGWKNDKSVGVLQMTKKSSLAEYLRNGLTIIGR